MTAWLRALCREVHARCGGPGVGAVGMCLTGGFVLSMMVDPVLMAPVACQPSLPLTGATRFLFNKDALGMSDSDLAAAKARHAESVPLMALRYATDVICPIERLDRLDREFPNLQRIEIPADRKRHATLTEDFSPAA